MLRAILSSRSRIVTKQSLPRTSSKALTAAFSSAAQTSEDDEDDLTPAEFRKVHQISLLDAVGRPLRETFEPILRFEDAPFEDKLKTALLKQGYTSPTPTQAQSWPIVTQKRDVISVARTGSGKTCGFLLPAFQKIIEERATGDEFEIEEPSGKKWSFGRGQPRKQPKVLVLAPTRELCMQIHTEAQKFARFANIDPVCLYGGSPKGPQISELRRGVDIVIGTPGRVNDLIETGFLKLSQATYFVLDEADRMLDMGFEPQIREIIYNLPELNARQNVFFSATWPKEVQALAREFLENPVHIAIGDTDKLNANKNIKQVIHCVREGDKEEKFFQILEEIGGQPQSDNMKAHFASFPKTIVFRSKKTDCDELGYQLRQAGFRADVLHGDKSQDRRDATMDKFRRGVTRMIVATDVAARGIDIKDIECVVNYDFPASGIEDYVHRIGRTGRGSASGTAHSFITPEEGKKEAKDLIDILRRSEQEVPSQLEDMAHKSAPQPRKNRYNQGGGGNRYQKGDWKNARGFGGDRYGGGDGGFSRDGYDRGSRGGGGRGGRGDDMAFRDPFAGRGRKPSFDDYDDDFGSRRGGGRGGSRGGGGGGGGRRRRFDDDDDYY